MFRISGSEKAIQDLIKSEKPNFAIIQDPHTVAGFIKRWLRSHTPLVEAHRYEDFVEIYGKIIFDWFLFFWQKHNFSFFLKDLDEPEKIPALKKIISQLPDGNQATLFILIDMLGVVSEHSSKNLMTASNLGGSKLNKRKRIEWKRERAKKKRFNMRVCCLISFSDFLNFVSVWTYSCSRWKGRSNAIGNVKQSSFFTHRINDNKKRRSI